LATNLCQISKEPLQAPSLNDKSNIYVCKLGYIYNKEELLKKLIEKQMPKEFIHIKKLKDVKDVKSEH
jgi:hypothetical protein